MAKLVNQVKLTLLKGMEAIGRGASNLASNAQLKVSEINLETRRREILSEFPLRAHDLWQKGVTLPEPLGDMMAELNDLDERLSVLRAQRYAKVEGASPEGDGGEAGDGAQSCACEAADAADAEDGASENGSFTTDGGDEANGADSSDEAASTPDNDDLPDTSAPTPDEADASAHMSDASASAPDNDDASAHMSDASASAPDNAAPAASTGDNA